MSDKGFADDIGGIIVSAVIIVLVVVAVAAVAVIGIYVAAIVAIGAACWFGYKLIDNPKKREAQKDLNETKRLYRETKDLEAAYELDTRDEFVDDVIRRIIRVSDGLDITVPTELLVTYSSIVEDEYDRVFDPIGELELERIEDKSGHIKVRNYLRDQKELYGAGSESLQTIKNVYVEAFVRLIDSLPKGIVTNERPVREGLNVQVIDMLEDPASMVEHFLLIGENDSVGADELHAFEDARLAARSIVADASGVALSDLDEVDRKKIILPTKAKMSPRELVRTYLRGTPYFSLFGAVLPFELPGEARFEHTHIVAGTGHGKTQLFQLLIKEDLDRMVAEGDRSVVVIDGQGSLIDNILHMPHFGKEGALRDRVVIVDPREINQPPCLNMFDLNEERLAKYGQVEREMIYNGTLDLYAYLFGALLGADLTQKQDVVFRYLAELMVSIPGATLTTLREAVDDPGRFQSEINKLDPTSQAFFETQLKDPSYDDTRKQISRRLWGVIQNKALSRMFNNPKNKVDLFDATNAGKIILINTAKDFLKTDACQIFGRFFIAMTAQAALQRATLPNRERIDTHVYIDEAHEYIDDKVEELLNQARKFRVGLHLAHQNLDQLSPQQRASFGSSTSIKFAGGVSDKDARAFSGDMRLKPEEILAAKKHDKSHAEYQCFIKNVTDRAVRLDVPFGIMEREGRINQSEFDALLAQNRALYGASVRDRTPDPSNEPGQPPADAGETKPAGFVLGDHEKI